MIGYLDSSALLKLYLHDESEADILREAMELLASLVTSRLAYVEVRAGLAAARRAGRMTAIAHDIAVEDFDRVWPEYDVVEIDPALGHRAADTAEQYGLRAGDAIHLASALLLGDGVSVVAWDERFRAAASAAGLPVFPAAA